MAGLVKGTWRRDRGCYLNKPPRRISVAEVFRAFGEPHTLEVRRFASRGLSDPEFEQLGGTDLLWQALNGSILLFLEGVSLADIAPAADETWSDHVGRRVH